MSQLSRPWKDEEFVIFDGHKLVYSAKNQVIDFVHMPGGWSISLGQLKRMAKVALVEPFKVRNVPHGMN
jgi:hypothetical protein